ncbi:MAG: hypothetical protein A2136_01415 [Chloroflexi bacterium RBG_16_54_11]|nr:MAG: hypothetical protein A2136_01415 [Chloroflexi bacterium RBG_16_54_11]
MKKVVYLAISVGLLAIILLIFISISQASGDYQRNSAVKEGSRELVQASPPWFNDAWHYRRPVIINSNTALPWYQVLVKLDGSNFPSFPLVNPDGSDVRFTHSDGTTLLSYWIESWDSVQEVAFVWVRVPGLVNGLTTIYIYYNNPSATPASDGVTTFDGFDDDWDDFTGARFAQYDGVNVNRSAEDIESPFSWSVIMGIPEVIPPGVLSLADGTGIKSTSTHQYQAVGFKANYGLGDGHEWVGFINGVSEQRTMIGDLPADVDDLYLINYVNAPDNTILEGPNPWHDAFHIYEVRWNPGWSQGEIDHGASTATSLTQVPNTTLPVTLFSDLGSNATLLVDWIYLRQFHNPEPVVGVGEEQGLVQLGINQVDSPDPLPQYNSLTYQLSIFNTGLIDAPGVVVTDTLPADVQIGPISSSQGSCLPGAIVLCSLNTIQANTMANITIVVTPTVDGVITNTAVVGSPGFELDLSDNQAEEMTLVDSVPPVVNWEKPVQNGGTYVTYGGSVLLEASATDNDQVAWVEYKYWDHNSSGWISIGSDYSYPYQVLFNSDVLEPYQLYQTFVLGTDRAGNQSNPYNPLQRILIERRLWVFLPFMNK